MHTCHVEVHRNVAGALWSLASFPGNQLAIAEANGIPPLVNLLSTGAVGAQETAAGALHVCMYVCMYVYMYMYMYMRRPPQVRCICTYIHT